MARTFLLTLLKRILLGEEAAEDGVEEGFEGGEVAVGGDEDEVIEVAIGAGDGDEPVAFGELSAGVGDGRGAAEEDGLGGAAGDLHCRGVADLLQAGALGEALDEGGGRAGE